MYMYISYVCCMHRMPHPITLLGLVILHFERDREGGREGREREGLRERLLHMCTSTIDGIHVTY